MIAKSLVCSPYLNQSEECVTASLDSANLDYCPAIQNFVAGASLQYRLVALQNLGGQMY